MVRDSMASPRLGFLPRERKIDLRTENKQEGTLGIGRDARDISIHLLKLRLRLGSMVGAGLDFQEHLEGIDDRQVC